MDRNCQILRSKDVRLKNAEREFRLWVRDGFLGSLGILASNLFSLIRVSGFQSNSLGFGVSGCGAEASDFGTGSRG